MKWPLISQTLMLSIALCFSPLSEGAPSTNLTVHKKPQQVIWIDVRTPAEHQQDSIPNDINIPYDIIAQQVSRRFPDKTTEIHVYCRSGKRAAKALLSLQKAGYTKVLNAGGINDARKARSLNK